MDRYIQKMVLAVTAVALGVVSWGCEETTPPEPPPPPPQISFEVYSLTASDDKHRLPSNDVYDVFVDGQDRVWFAHDQGVSMKADANADIHTFGLLKPNGTESGLPNRLVRAVGELNGRIYVGTWGGGAAVLDESDSTWTALLVDAAGDTGLVDSRVASIVRKVSTGTLFFGTVNGTSEYLDTPGLTDSQRWTNHTSKMGFSRVVSQMFFIPGTTRGDEVWIATKDGGITVVRSFSWTRYDARFTGLPQNDVNGITYDAANDLIWTALATQCVASVDVDASVWTQLTTVNGFASNLATGAAVRIASDDAAEELWIGTQTGISVRRVLTETKTINYIKGSGLPVERVRTLRADRNGQIWACFIDGGAGRVDTYEK